MHVVAGKYKGEKLVADEKWTRPTTSKVKEAVFSIIGRTVEQIVFLDLFCGSAAMAIEALSRGATLAVAIDKRVDKAFLNKKEIGVENLEIYKNDALRALTILFKRESKFDYIYVDPPYDYNQKLELLKAISKFAILKPKGKIFFELRSKEDLPNNCEGLIKTKEYGYGYMKLVVYGWENE